MVVDELDGNRRCWEQKRGGEEKRIVDEVEGRRCRRRLTRWWLEMAGDGGRVLGGEEEWRRTASWRNGVRVGPPANAKLYHVCPLC